MPGRDAYLDGLLDMGVMLPPRYPLRNGTMRALTDIAIRKLRPDATRREIPDPGCVEPR